MSRRPRKVVLENGVLDTLARSSAILRSFPVFKKLNQSVSGGCGGCSGGFDQGSSAIYRDIKHTIAGFSTTQKMRLKELAKADVMEITFKGSGGRFETISF